GTPLWASTGHTYWAAAVAVALVLGVASALAVVVRQFRGGLRGERTMGPDGGPRLAGGPAALPVSIFLTQEILERLDAGARLVTLQTGRLLLVGVLIQVLI